VTRQRLLGIEALFPGDGYALPMPVMPSKIRYNKDRLPGGRYSRCTESEGSILRSEFEALGLLIAVISNTFVAKWSLSSCVFGHVHVNSCVNINNLVGGPASAAAIKDSRD